jgi:hypothetical protein
MFMHRKNELDILFEEISNMTLSLIVFRQIKIDGLLLMKMKMIKIKWFTTLAIRI